MKVRDLAAHEVSRRLKGDGLGLQTGPFRCLIRSPLPAVAQGLSLLYAEHTAFEPGNTAFIDFHVAIEPRWSLQGAQAAFCYDGREPFARMPRAHAFALLEWGLNWCAYNQVNQVLSLHSATLARGEQAVLMPAHSGSGKSTLCAALAFQGWRLLSDELALVDPSDGVLWPLPRPISLKNASIDVIRAREPMAVHGPVVRETHKGSVCHFQPPAPSVWQEHLRPRPRWVVFPRWEADAALQATPLSRGQGFMRLREQAFNFAELGTRAFETLANVAEGCDFFELHYSRLDEALPWFERLADAP